ncbi:PAS domain S-box protein [Gemmatimonadota bacterium]
MSTKAGQFQDITERKRAEEALRQSEATIRSVFGAVPVGICIMKDRVYQSANKNWCESFGYPEESILGKTTRLLYENDEEHQRVGQELYKNLLERGLTSVETRLRRSDGVFRDVALRAAPLQSDDLEAGIVVVIHDITERKRAEEALRERQNLLQTIMDNITSGVLIKDTNGRYLMVNHMVERIVGRNAGEIIGKTPIDIYPPEIAEKIIADDMKVVESGRPLTIEEKLSQNDDSVYLTTKVPLFDVDGKLRGLCGLFTDITESKWAEEALRESEERFRYLADATIEAIFINKKGICLEANQAAAEMFGYKDASELVGIFGTDVIAPESHEIVREHMLKNLPETYEAIGIRKDGSRFPIEIKAKRMPYKDEGIVRVTAVRDITERKKIAAHLEEWKKRYETAVISSGHILYDWDSNTNEVIFGGDLKNILGYTTEEMEGGLARWMELIHPEDKDHFKGVIKHLLTTKEPAHLEYRIRRKDGNYINIEDAGRFIEDAEGNVVRMIGFAKDISERKQLEEERAKAAKLESIGLLAGGIAHDFNNILSIILGNVSLASMIAKEEKSATSEYLIDAGTGCSRARELTQQLLTFSKGGEPIKKTASLSGLIKEASVFALRGSNVKCRRYISKDLWPCEIDEGQISQVINNLILNADQAMPEGGTINLRAENDTVGKEGRLPLDEGRYVKLTIKDQGLGISKEHLSKIFDPYFSTKQKGSGLGLATTYSIIKRHGGHISVESELKVGTTFYIYLPVSWKQVEGKEVKKKEITVTRGRILVMDDEQALREVISRMLEQIGHEVECANNGTQAVKIYKQAKESGQPFDAVILDLTIPGGMGGQETVKKLIEIDPEVKAIVSSGYSNDPVLANFRDYGFNSKVSKPYRIEELREVVQSVMQEKNG